MTTKIGIVVGAGTGPELAALFRESLATLAADRGVALEIVDCPHEFATYHQVCDSSHAEVEAAVERDVAALDAFYRELHRQGGRVVFRTAINAESLYLVRRAGEAVKSVLFEVGNRRLLMVRDQMQGFYANDACDFGDERVVVTASLSRTKTRRVIEFGLAEAERQLRRPFETWVVYKHHLFSNRLGVWAREALPGCRVIQPNHATELLHNLVKWKEGEDILMVTGNEVGDILHEVLIFWLNAGLRTTLCSRNVYLGAGYPGLAEYQTVHGSADNLAGEERVNPFGTLRAMAAILDHELGVEGFAAEMEAALEETRRRRVVTPDLGGDSPTRVVADQVLGLLRTAPAAVLS